MATISFFTEDIVFTLPQKRAISSWLKNTIHTENFYLEHINIIFCSDNYLLSINQAYLNHDYYTDIITFNHSENNPVLEGDIYISIDRVKENALQYQSTFTHELCRVMVHGVLHLCGYNDHTTQEKETMRTKENHYITLLQH